jgi:ribosomal protein S18 acetylase RimI-like enzyme
VTGPVDPPGARRMAAGERAAALATMVAAFAADPLVRWWFPDDGAYPEQAGLFFGTLLDLRAEGGEVWLADGAAAVSMWTPPGGLLVAPARQEVAFAAMNAALPDAAVRGLVRVDERVHAALPRRPHWYLGVLATAPDRRGRGLAGAVLAPVLAHADRSGLDVWLETAAERNLGFYARHGFVVAQSITVDDAPQVHVLRRSAGPG